MVTITGLKFDSVDGATGVVDMVSELSQQGLITMRDAAAVTWQNGDKRPHTMHLHEMTGDDAPDAVFWGLLFGLIFFVPYMGMAVGSAMGSLVGKFSRYGVDRTFIFTIQDKVNEGSSALFLLTADVLPGTVLESLRCSEFDYFYRELTGDQERELLADFSAKRS